jgi:hypothetical protein
MNPERIIQGAGGGSDSSAQHAAIEAPDNLHSIAYARVLDLWSEGQIQGFVHPTNVLQDLALNGTPVANADGSLNFKNIQFDSRAGTQSQSYMTGFPDVENETAVGLELTDITPWTQALTDLTLSAVRVRLSVPSLQKEDTTTGDILGYTIQYAIDIQTDGGSFATMLTSAFTGKTTGKYERAHRLDLPAATSGWTVRVRRLTANQHLATVSDTTTVESYTEIVDAKFRYPNSAYGGLIVDASQFSSIPTRAFNLLGRIISVPSNYNPATRIYTGAWDGTFKPAWTNNPAWIFYDIVINNRFGLGQYVNAAQINKWALYTIAQYCDELVPDGFGGTEPRMTCTVYLQSQADAYKVLQDIGSVFRGISYWAGGAIQAVADMPGDPVYTLTAANVIGGKFTYQGSGLSTRWTVALVSWNDPNDFGRAKVEYVPDDTGIARYGVLTTPVTGFGCTSQGQAHRIGLWTLYTSRLETGTVTFKMGLDGLVNVAPGQIIRISDPARVGKRQAGRIHAATTTAITVDAAPTVAVGDSLTCTLSTGVTETHAVTAVAGAVISVAAPGFSEAPRAESVWVVESSTLTAETYRVLGILEDATPDTDKISFTVTAVLHNASKFDAIDFGDPISVPPVSAIPPSTQPGPASVTITSSETAHTVLASVLLTINWAATANAVSYRVQWRKDNGDWVTVNSKALSLDIQSASPGIYAARVTAINAKGVGSVPVNAADYIMVDQTRLPGSVYPVVMNANFINGLNGWTPDFAAEWAAASTGSPSTLIPTCVVHTYAGDGTTALRNSAFNPVQPGDIMTMTCQIAGAGGPNGAAWMRIGWYDNTGTEIGSQDGTHVTGNTTASSRTSGVAPTGAVACKAELVAGAHTVGSYAFTGVTLARQANSMDEVPDGAIRIGGVQYSDSEVVDNAAFEAATTVPPPGWAASGGATLSYTTAAGAYAGAQSLHVVTTIAGQGSVISTRKYKCRPGDVYLLAAQIYGAAAGISASFQFWSSATGFVALRDAGTRSATGYALTGGQVQVPAGADYFFIVFRTTGAAGTAFNVDDVVLGKVRTQDGIMPITWAGVRSVLSTSPITYSISTASPAVVTFSVAAFTNYGGGLNVAYNAAGGSLTQARGTTVTYYLYYRDAISAGGSQTLHVTTNVSDLAQFPDIVNIGNATVTVAASGGGTGGGGGGGGFCVGAGMFVDEDTPAAEAQPGHLFDCCDLPTRGIETFKRRLLSVEYHDAECVCLTTDGGAVLECGITTPFDTPDRRELRAPQMLGQQVLTDHGLETVVSVEPIGIRPVCFFHFGGISYAAGADPAHRIYSHNGVSKP